MLHNDKASGLQRLRKAKIQDGKAAAKEGKAQ
jgi:hypothetical protein